jgi:hypothetical protein
MYQDTQYTCPRDVAACADYTAVFHVAAQVLSVIISNAAASVLSSIYTPRTLVNHQHVHYQKSYTVTQHITTFRSTTEHIYEGGPVILYNIIL